jgi:DNA-binding MarR family transcriptional regulator
MTRFWAATRGHRRSSPLEDRTGHSDCRASVTTGRNPNAEVQGACAGYLYTLAITIETDNEASTDSEQSTLLSFDLLDVLTFVKRRSDAACELSDRRRHVLELLAISRRLTVSQLAKACGVSHQSMSDTIQELEQARYVDRRADRKDRRQKQVGMTQSGRRALERERPARRAWLAEAIRSKLSSAEQAELRRGLSHLRRVFLDPYLDIEA